MISIVGRFLEHSRIYIFGSKGREKVYIASADYMTRNTLRRVEVAAPVCDPAIRERLLEMFRIMLNDNQKARHEDSEGNYRIPMTIERPWMLRKPSISRRMKQQRQKTCDGDCFAFDLKMSL